MNKVKGYQARGPHYTSLALGEGGHDQSRQRWRDDNEAASFDHERHSPGLDRARGGEQPKS